MDTRRTLLWVIFSVSLLFLWDAWLKHTGQPSMFSPPAAPMTAPAATASAPGASVDASVPQPTVASSVAAPQAGAVPTTQGTQASEQWAVRTDVLSLLIDSQGAQVRRVELLKHKDTSDKSKNVILLSEQHQYVARTGLVGVEGVPNHNTPYRLVSNLKTLPEGQNSFDLVLEAISGNIKVQKIYTFYRGRYDIGVKHVISNQGTAALEPRLYLQLVRDGNAPKGESKFYSTFTGPAVYTEVEKFRKVSFSDIEKDQAEHIKTTNNGWVAMIQHYFVTAWVPKQGTDREIQTRKVDTNLYAINSIQKIGTLAPGASVTVESQLFSGPQDQKVLAALAPGLDLVVDYGWLTMLAKPLFWLLQLFHGWTDNWGWAIILLTVLVKAVFYPLSAASYKSMAKMRAVTPRMMKIRDQYKDDRQKMNMAMMELYKTEKINPLGGCLPMLVQIPVFIALYWTLLAAVEMRGAPWLGWIQDLTTPDPWYILPVIMIATMWVQYKLNPTPPDPIQAKVFAVMPFIFGGMMIFFPSGLVLYWVVNNILSIAQQWQITRMIEGKPLFGRASPDA
jgi:YidC/Oxa1 family membrane protein insertase